MSWTGKKTMPHASPMTGVLAIGITKYGDAGKISTSKTRMYA